MIMNFPAIYPRLFRYLLLVTVLFACALSAADWPMRGKDASRNAVSMEKNAPLDWEVVTERGKVLEKKSRNLRWSAQLGSVTWCDPVIANGLVWVGTNNEKPRDEGDKQDAGVLM
ncbi:MAG TPA: hypothetical protein EYQ50_16040 [Verrucomicrobiales bacterium]|nr:hypothetical protein [Verrucomicrobiales bacterium]HIL68774.1 hypothetical protein [Verrucomicrobiota bacterium]